MRSPFDRVEEALIVDLVTTGWGLPVDALDYCPEGGGAYHWIAETEDAGRWFVTCDDLDTKPWLGADRETVFDNLVAAYGTAIDLRASGLAFVVAPLASASGAPAERLDERHSLSVFDYVRGVPEVWGRPVSPAGRAHVVTMLAALHRYPSPLHQLARRDLAVPGRDGLDAALRDLDRPWHGGPLSEAARAELAAHIDRIGRWLADLDRLGDAGSTAVVTHGEPHPGNLIRTDTGVALVDWDTVAFAPPERDMWMVAEGDASAVAAYRELTGTQLDDEAMAAYRLLWAVTDVAAFALQLRDEHQQDADGERALAGLRSILEGREPSPYGVGPSVR